jgi:hypothetical protein
LSTSIWVTTDDWKLTRRRLEPICGALRIIEVLEHRIPA